MNVIREVTLENEENEEYNERIEPEEQYYEEHEEYYDNDEYNSEYDDDIIDPDEEYYTDNEESITLLNYAHFHYNHINKIKTKLFEGCDEKDPCAINDFTKYFNNLMADYKTNEIVYEKKNDIYCDIEECRKIFIQINNNAQECFSKGQLVHKVIFYEFGKEKNVFSCSLLALFKYIIKEHISGYIIEQITLS